jgi:phosphatidylserine/phosphatidylglycerophosphate/cardiolipin synthase-like enzyme
VLVDAAGYFSIARQAMLRAQKQLLLIGWDFDTRICLDHEADDGAPVELGEFLTWLPKHRPDLQIHILKWDVGAIGVIGRGSTIFRLVRWASSKQIHFKLDGAHPMGASHHQKIVVIDDKLAFCGGIDMTACRWDTRDHSDDDQRRRRPTTGRRYPPWHDATMAVDGDVAKAIGELARERWETAGGDPITPPQATTDPWPDTLEPAFGNVKIAIARTRGQHKDVEPLREIEALYLDAVKRTKRFLYAENQYFSSRVIAEAIAERLKEEDPPEFVIVNPVTSQGWLDEEAMSPARAKLMEAVRVADTKGRFRIFTPITAGGDDIYVHSKITIVDGELIRVGSANMNNRSMGLDSECDLLIDAQEQDNEAAVQTKIVDILADLLAEHLGTSPRSVFETLQRTGSLIATIESLRGAGRALVPYIPRQPNAVEEKLAELEALDPESSGHEFEPVARPGLVRGFAGMFSRRAPHSA